MSDLRDCTIHQSSSTSFDTERRLYSIVHHFPLFCQTPEVAWQSRVDWKEELAIERRNLEFGPPALGSCLNRRHAHFKVPALNVDPYSALEICAAMSETEPA